MDLTLLAERYASMETEELVALQSTGTLLDDAYPVLESEFRLLAIFVDQ